MPDGKEIIGRQTETHRMLQEMLLDIIVEQLEHRSYTATSSEGKIVEMVELLKMLSEMMNVRPEEKRDPSAE